MLLWVKMLRRLTATQLVVRVVGNECGEFVDVSGGPRDACEVGASQDALLRMGVSALVSHCTLGDSPVMEASQGSVAAVDDFGSLPSGRAETHIFGLGFAQLCESRQCTQNAREKESES